MPLGDYTKIEDFKTEKHVPVIDAPKFVSGTPGTVTVTVGKEIPHPNKTDHFIQWIALYFIPKGGKVATELATAQFSAHGASVEGADTGVAYAHPAVTVSVTLTTSGTLIAQSYCNIHGLWESSADVTL